MLINPPESNTDYQPEGKKELKGPQQKDWVNDCLAAWTMAGKLILEKKKAITIFVGISAAIERLCEPITTLANEEVFRDL